MNKNIILCGVGGQGTVLASKLIAASAMEKGMEVMSAETIGMAQRGGNVFSNIRISDEGKLYAPMIGKGQADVILGFEPGETVRMLPFLKKGGYVITNIRPVKPTTATLMGSAYDGEEMIDYLHSVIDADHLLIVDGTRASAELGNPRCLNVVLLGAAVRIGAIGLTEEDILSSMPKVIKPRFLELNERAFRYA
ncbi:MAG: indolepyruvate oxidoreductase subunit beta [Lachnospiraceae bacterium]|nr:indolepyruvate oxidoreductase subunit beta [Lachnospiraceae bacterium]